MFTLVAKATAWQGGLAPELSRRVGLAGHQATGSACCLVAAHPTTSVDQSTEIERLRHQVEELQAAQAIAEKRAAIAALLVEHSLPPLRVGQAPPDTDLENAITSAFQPSPGGNIVYFRID